MEEINNRIQSTPRLATATARSDSGGMLLDGAAAGLLFKGFKAATANFGLCDVSGMPKSSYFQDSFTRPRDFS